MSDDIELSEIGMAKYTANPNGVRHDLFFEMRGRALTRATELQRAVRVLGPNSEVLDTVQPLPPSPSNALP